MGEIDPSLVPVDPYEYFEIVVEHASVSQPHGASMRYSQERTAPLPIRVVNHYGCAKP
jgi:hypothetical protein